MDKRAKSLNSLLGEFKGAFGSVKTDAIPFGGQITGPILQSLLLAGLGYGGGRLAGYLMPKVIPHRLGLVAGAGAAMLPWFYHGLGLRGNFNDWRQDPTRTDKSWWEKPVYFLKSMNRDPFEAPPQREGHVKGSGFTDPSFVIRNASPIPDGFGIPVAHTMGMIRTDPLLSPTEKARAISIIERAQPKGTGIISWPTVSRAAVGAGIGFTSAMLFGKALDTLFGGLSSSSQRKLQGAGTIAGMLLNTGAIR